MMPLWFRKTYTSASQHLTMSLLTLQGPLTLLFNIKLVNSLLLLFKGLTQDCRATDVVASDGPDPTRSTEFTHPEDLPVGTTIYEFSRSQRGEIPAASLFLGRKCPIKHYFISGYSGKLGIPPWALLVPGGSKPLIKTNAQVLHRGCSLWPQHQHTQHLFIPLNHFTSFFFYQSCKDSPPP